MFWKSQETWITIVNDGWPEKHQANTNKPKRDKDVLKCRKKMRRIAPGELRFDDSLQKII